MDSGKIRKPKKSKAQNDSNQNANEQKEQASQDLTEYEQKTQENQEFSWEDEYKKDVLDEEKHIKHDDIEQEDDYGEDGKNNELVDHREDNDGREDHSDDEDESKKIKRRKEMMANKKQVKKLMKERKDRLENRAQAGEENAVNQAQAREEHNLWRFNGEMKYYDTFNSSWSVVEKDFHTLLERGYEFPLTYWEQDEYHNNLLIRKLAKNYRMIYFEDKEQQIEYWMEILRYWPGEKILDYYEKMHKPFMITRWSPIYCSCETALRIAKVIFPKCRIFQICGFEPINGETRYVYPICNDLLRDNIKINLDSYLRALENNETELIDYMEKTNQSGFNRCKIAKINKNFIDKCDVSEVAKCGLLTPQDMESIEWIHKNVPEAEFYALNHTQAELLQRFCINNGKYFFLLSNDIEDYKPYSRAIIYHYLCPRYIKIRTKEDVIFFRALWARTTSPKYDLYHKYEQALSYTFYLRARDPEVMLFALEQKRIPYGANDEEMKELLECVKHTTQLHPEKKIDVTVGNRSQRVTYSWFLEDPERLKLSFYHKSRKTSWCVSMLSAEGDDDFYAKVIGNKIPPNEYYPCKKAMEYLVNKKIIDRKRINFFGSWRYKFLQSLGYKISKTKAKYIALKL